MWLCARLTLGIVLAAQLGLAQTNLSVLVPLGCGSKDAFVAELRSLKSSERALAELELSVEITYDETNKTYTLAYLRSDEQRKLSDPDCTTLFRTAVVIAAASMSEPQAESPPKLVTNDATPLPTPAASATSVAPQEARNSRTITKPPPPKARPAQRVAIVDVNPVDESGERPAIDFEFHLAAGAVLGLTPKLAVAAEGGALLGLDRWALSMLARYVPETTTNADSGARMRADVWGGRLGVGYDVTSKLRGQVGISAYRVHGEAVGIRHPQADSVWFVAPELEASVEVVQWADWSAEVALQWRVALNTPRFEMEPDAVVFAVPRAGAAAFFRIKWGP